MTKVLISCESRYPVSRFKIRTAVGAILKEKGITSDCEVSILVCGTRKSSDLAKKYLQDDNPHNVLSFPLLEDVKRGDSRPFAKAGQGRGFAMGQNEVLILGDIVVCYPLVQEEANRDNVLIDTKVAELVSHGMLHLLGEHHEEMSD